MDNIPIKTGEGPQETREVPKDSAALLQDRNECSGGRLHNEKARALRQNYPVGVSFA